MKLFRTATAALILGGMVLGVGMPAVANSGDPNHRGGMDGRGGAQHRFISPEVLGSLDLTQEQKADLWDLYQGKRNQRRSRDEDSKVRSLMQKVHSGQTVDEDLKAAARSEISGRIMERQQDVTKLYRILTPEQRVKVESAREARQERRRERLEKRAECAGEGQHMGNGQGLKPGNGQGERLRSGNIRGRYEGAHFMGRMSDELNLTDTQKVRISEIIQEHRGDRKDRREGFRETRGERREMMQMAWAEAPDQGKIREAADKLAADRVERMLQGGEMMKKIRGVLTEEQLEKLDSCRENWQEGRHFGPRGQK